MGQIGPGCPSSRPPVSALRLTAWGLLAAPFLSSCPQRVHGLHAFFLHWGLLPWGSSGFPTLQNSWLTYKCLMEKWRTRVHFWGGTGADGGRGGLGKGRRESPFRFQTVRSRSLLEWAASPESTFLRVAAPSLPVLRNSPRVGPTWAVEAKPAGTCRSRLRSLQRHLCSVWC